MGLISQIMHALVTNGGLSKYLILISHKSNEVRSLSALTTYSTI